MLRLERRQPANSNPDSMLEDPVDDRPFTEEDELWLAARPRRSTRTREPTYLETSEDEPEEDGDQDEARPYQGGCQTDNDDEAEGFVSAGPSIETDEQIYHRERAQFDVLAVSDAVRKREARATPNGYVQFNKDGELEYSRDKYGEYKPAIFHHWIREPLANHENAKGHYAPWLGPNPRAHGFEPHDRTCYNRSQYRWGTTPEDYPPVIFRYERKDLTNDPRPVNYMTWNGKLVIDWWLLPVKDFVHIPRVLSSEYEGCFMEASVRLHDNVTIHDFQARMPPALLRKTRGPIRARRLYERNALSARMRRFRIHAGCITWNPRQDSDILKRFMDARLKPENIAKNSTKGLGDLTEEEKARYDKLNHGKYSKRARHDTTED